MYKNLSFFCDFFSVENMLVEHPLIKHFAHFFVMTAVECKVDI